MIITKLLEAPKKTVTDGGEVITEPKSPIDRAKVVGVQANETWTQFLVNVPAYQIKDVTTAFTEKESLPYILINYEDGRTEKFMFHNPCSVVSHSRSPIDTESRLVQFAVWCWNWPNDFKNIEEFTVGVQEAEVSQEVVGNQA